jgi:hypothetical protein
MGQIGDDPDARITQRHEPVGPSRADQLDDMQALSVEALPLGVTHGGGCFTLSVDPTGVEKDEAVLVYRLYLRALERLLGSGTSGLVQAIATVVGDEATSKLLDLASHSAVFHPQLAGPGVALGTYHRP